MGIPDRYEEWRKHACLHVLMHTNTYGTHRYTDQHLVSLWWLNYDDLNERIGRLEGEGLLTWDANSNAFTVTEPQLRAMQATIRVDRHQGASAEVFVASWFDARMDLPYRQGIRPAIEEDCGYSAVWIKPVHTIQKIDDMIMASIRSCRFMVCDVTGHRAAVYFEAGFAMGLKIPVVWTCHARYIRRACFDTRQYSHIVWQEAEDLRSQLTARIKALAL